QLFNQREETARNTELNPESIAAEVKEEKKAIEGPKIRSKNKSGEWKESESGLEWLPNEFDSDSDNAKEDEDDDDGLAEELEKKKEDMVDVMGSTSEEEQHMLKKGKFQYFCV
ncbi:unnamed protein product, partial [Owenia fusiformis]